MLLVAVVGKRQAEAQIHCQISVFLPSTMANSPVGVLSQGPGMPLACCVTWKSTLPSLGFCLLLSKAWSWAMGCMGVLPVLLLWMGEGQSEAIRTPHPLSTQLCSLAPGRAGRMVCQLSCQPCMRRAFLAAKKGGALAQEDLVRQSPSHYPPLLSPCGKAVKGRV